MADNLSTALQGSTVSASEGQSLMRMTITALESIRSGVLRIVLEKNLAMQAGT